LSGSDGLYTSVKYEKKLIWITQCGEGKILERGVISDEQEGRKSC